MTETNPTLQQVVQAIQKRSQTSRAAYLDSIQKNRTGAHRPRHLSCSNLAHGVAVLAEEEKQKFLAGEWKNVAIVSAYNDMLSAHQPYAEYPGIIKTALARRGINAQFAGGVPAMCDGITQGQPGMELSLLSRDVIARSTAIALSHNMFDAAICLGICDKIVPGLLIGALTFGHLPVLFLPSGPMPSGLSNTEKSKIRQEYAAGEVDSKALLKAEMQCYHTSGTCTFYGTANSNQVLMEFMGLHLPGASFVNPGTPERASLTQQALSLLADQLSSESVGLAGIVNEYALVNAMVGLLTTGGSSNHTIHLIAIAKACGIQLCWEDFQSLSTVVPLLARIYPNGQADVNRFHELGGVPYCIGELLKGGLLFPEVETILGRGLHQYATSRPSTDESVLRPLAHPFSDTGGLQALSGNLGKAIVKTSSVDPERFYIRAPAVVFETQQALQAAFKQGQLERDCVVVVRFQGPRANGMPELHQLMPVLGHLQDKGFKVALVTDGRLSGASGKVPAAIHCTPEAYTGGGLARVRHGDLIELDIEKNALNCLVPEQEWLKRIPVSAQCGEADNGMGRELFTLLRAHMSDAASGATTF